MSKPFDATTKQLVEADPAAWLAYIGLSGTTAEMIDTDLSTITAEADRAMRVQGPAPYLAHIEFQAGYDPLMGKRLLRYNVLLHYQHDLPVKSVLVLLRRPADGPAMTGVYRYEAPQADDSVDFRYRVVRVWEKPVEQVLTGGLETLPLAPLADVSPDALPEVIRRMELRIKQEAAPGEAGLLWTATFVLMGLKYDPAFTEQLLKGVQGMEESSTYQYLIAKGEAKGRAEGEAQGRAEGEAQGRAEEARSLIMRLGRKRFGSPDAGTQVALDAVASVERLEELAERLLEVESWLELLSG